MEKWSDWLEKVELITGIDKKIYKRDKICYVRGNHRLRHEWDHTVASAGVRAKKREYNKDNFPTHNNSLPTPLEFTSP